MSFKPHKNHNWVWYFLLLAVLTVVSLTVLFGFNQAQQLTEGKIEEARNLWRRRGPATYEMVYNQTGTVPGKFHVWVRDNKVLKVDRNGEPLEERLLRYHDMFALYGFMEDFLKEDTQPGKHKTYTVASFDPQDGHLIHYVRRVMGGNERVELTVSITAPGSLLPGT